jgi:hypothetical protein
VTHGRFSISEFQRLYGVSQLTEDQVDPRLREWSYGYGLTKMVAFWHSPFERFIHIDADTVCWGDFTEGLPWREYDLIYNEPHETITPFIQRTQYFDPELIESRFRWEGRPFFNSGIFLGRRGMFDLDEYLELLAAYRRNPSSVFADQGMLNMLSFRAIESGKIRARDWPFQALVPVTSVEELENRFTVRDRKPVVRVGDARLIHWAGKKPKRRLRGTFPGPMAYFQREHLRARGGLRALAGSITLDVEDMHARLTARHGGSYVAAAEAKLRYLLRALAARVRLPRAGPFSRS